MHNRRNQVAVKPRPPSRKAAKAKPAPAFPSTIAIPPHRGSSPVAMALPQAQSRTPQAQSKTPQALFAIPPGESPASKPPPKRRKSAAKRRKPPGKTRRAKAAAARPDPAAALAAFALPRRDEPLVQPDPAPTAPTQGRALAKAQPEGLSAQIGQWLRLRLTRIWDRLGGVPDGRAPADQAELRRLRAENARLRDQLDALLALQSPAPASPRVGDPASVA